MLQFGLVFLSPHFVMTGSLPSPDGPQVAQHSPVCLVLLRWLQPWSPSASSHHSHGTKRPRATASVCHQSATPPRPLGLGTNLPSQRALQGPDIGARRVGGGSGDGRGVHAYAFTCRLFRFGAMLDSGCASALWNMHEELWTLHAACPTGKGLHGCT